MKESVVYQRIFNEGEALGFAKAEAEGFMKGRMKFARYYVLKFGTKRFGAPDEKSLETIYGIDTIEWLEDLALRILDASSWTELFGYP